MEHNNKPIVILVDNSSMPALSMFNPNDWNGDSKSIVQSCRSHYGLIIHATEKIKKIIQNADKFIQPPFNDLVAQWQQAKWEVNQCYYYVEIPDLHSYTQLFLSGIKTFLDTLVQLIYTENIVNAKIIGFNKSKKIIGGKLLNILSNNSKNENLTKQIILLISV